MLPVAILAGGLATRLRPITETIPKALVDVAGRPFAELQVEWLRARGVERIVFLVGYRGEMIREALGNGRRWNVSLQFVFDGPTLLGTGGALKRAVPQLGDAFFVMYGDAYLDCDVSAIEAAYTASGAPALMTILKNQNRWDVSNVLFDGTRLVRYSKRHLTPDMQHIDYGLSVVSRAALDPYPNDEPFDVSTVFEDLARAGRLAAFEVTKRFYEIGSPEGLEETRQHLGKPSKQPG
ncbi:MAG: nucleotidyltransferase family protein [Acidobacteria bacterium]|nr:nucleotidyltransferase family protein [Acidobacteriota bacterium]